MYNFLVSAVGQKSLAVFLMSPHFERWPNKVAGSASEGEQEEEKRQNSAVRLK